VHFTTGENVKRVSDIGHNPSWSSAGDEVLANVDQITDPMARSGAKEQLWAIEVASGKRRLITPADAVQASWSPNRHRIAFWGVHRGGQRDIWTIASSGGDPKPVTTDEALDWNPVWAPDAAHEFRGPTRVAGGRPSPRVYGQSENLPSRQRDQNGSRRCIQQLHTACKGSHCRRTTV
jgi:TolB protein